MDDFNTVFVTGGAGYVGSVLVPKLLQGGYNVRVLDLFLYGDHVLDTVRDHPNLTVFKGDLRDQDLLRTAIAGSDTVIHLACISNDPSFELDPDLGKSINYDAFAPLVQISKDSGVRRFVYASSSSVYGLSDYENVTEDHDLNPLTDYSKYKAMCETELLTAQTAKFVPVIIRPATVCGYSPRQRLDLTVNILTNHAVNNRRITIFGGKQMRPNIHIDDIVDLYLYLLELPDAKIAGKVYNAGYQNHTVADIGDIVRRVTEAKLPCEQPIEFITTPTDDIRSYHISSTRIAAEIGFRPKRSIENAAADLIDAFMADNIPDPMTDTRYYNVRLMQSKSIR
jgi:nucleoside-diphosphate-sugar epimerase